MQATTTDSVLLRLLDVGSERFYTFRQRTLLKANDIIVSDTENVWQIHCTLLGAGINAGYVMQFDILDLQIGGGFDAYKEFNDLIKKLSGVKDRLRLRLTTHGIIELVENRKELEQEWLKARATLAADKHFQQFPEPQKKALYDAGDKEYMGNHPMEQDLKKSPVHAAFFNEFYNRPFFTGAPLPLTSALKPSAIFLNEQFRLHLHGELAEVDRTAGICKLKMLGNLDKTGFNVQQWNGTFKERYPFLEEDLRTFLYEYEANYTLELKSGWLQHARIITWEQANRSVEVMVEFTIDEIRKV